MNSKYLHQNPFPGEGNSQGPTIPWYPVQFTADPSLAGNKPALELNHTWYEQGVGNRFKFGHLDPLTPGDPQLISAGAVLTPALPKADTVSASLTDAASGLVYGITLVTGGLVANTEVGNYLYMADLGVMVKILANTITNVIWSLKDTTNGPNRLDSNALPAGPAGGSQVRIIRPGHVTMNTTPLVPVGVLLNDTLEGSDIVYQTSGLGLIIGNNSGTTTTVGVPAVCAAGGIIEGGTAPAGLGDFLIVPLITYDGSNIKLPCYFRMSGA